MTDTLGKVMHEECYLVELRERDSMSRFFDDNCWNIAITLIDQYSCACSLTANAQCLSERFILRQHLTPSEKHQAAGALFHIKSCRAIS